MKQLEQAQAAVNDLETKLAQTRERWSTALANEKAATDALEEQQSKFNKRWAELSEAILPDGGAETAECDEGATIVIRKQQEEQAKQIVQLQHKLNQALENARQAESTRQDLKEALKLNETLQSKYDEVKTKYAAIRNTASSSPAPSGTNTNHSKESSGQSSDPTAKDSAPAPESSDSGGMSAEKIEKLQREHRRMRKEISALMASKEAAKAKFERAEKEREGLVEANVRLLQQISEKDDVNAKSLSTVLHLKSMTEQLTIERGTLEQQAKSANQLALAARLAANAKERVSEELGAEKASLEETLQEMEKKLSDSIAELERMTTDWSEASGKIAALNMELSNAMKRSEEILADVEKKDAEIRELMDSVGKADLQALEANDKLEKFEKLVKSPGSNAASSFTVEQLNVQVSVYKRRLECPVCRVRDKDCIIMRCRHMHCKQCVDERISNRSRKCPTCNIKFSEKDVEDIWLS